MLQNVNSYGLSHLCAFSVFEVAEESFADLAFNFPFLDIYFKNDRANASHHVEFYGRGFKYNKTSFNNLFEYLIFTEQHGFGIEKLKTYFALNLIFFNRSKE